MSQRRLTSKELLFLQETLSADRKNCDIRLREGEYQYDLARAIASFQLELYFPDVKETIRRSYGENKENDIQFIRKVQTILKKMEKSKVVTILPKKNPWELQRYALLCFEFQDADKNPVILATEQQRKQSQNLVQSMLSADGTLGAKPSYIKTKIGAFAFLATASYIMAVWALIQPLINSFVFILAFSVAMACSLLLGKMLSKKNL